jgi:hypothetical protein
LELKKLTLIFVPMILSYNELKDLCSKELKLIKNLRQFCRDNKLTTSQYNKLNEITNDRDKKKYTDLIKRFLDIVGYDVLELHHFRVRKRDKKGENGKETNNEPKH